MKFKVEIKNFGKIERATIQINNLTVLAGKNNVGKSFISKALYAFFHAMKTDPLHRILITYIDELSEILNTLKSSIPYYNAKDNEFIINTQNILSILRAKLLTIQNVPFSEKLSVVDSIANPTKQLEQTFIAYQKQISNKKRKIAGNTYFLGRMGKIINQLIQYTDKKENSAILFIDEPEAHLHPAWQVTLMKTLYQLASEDVNIVITTHSIDMLKCL